MSRRPLRLITRLGLALLVSLTALAAPAAQATATIPSSMAALGDSITAGFNACGWYVECRSMTWSTGTDSRVRSHYTRLLAKNPEIQGHAYNYAVSGAKVADLDNQASKAVRQNVQYVTILIGANDACTSSESTMTPVSTFETRFRAAMDTLESGLPDAAIFVSSIPDIKRLWYVLKNNPAARSVWAFAGICQSMLANPTSTAAADEARRDRVRQRVIDYNTVLARVCAEYPTCEFDDNAVFDYPFVASQISSWDYFHPNKAGQTVLAEVTYRNGFGW
ncbi:SGNH/GDSL hydrolase family protein [Carbonactinospora thermoautotrophica]|nr:SGNH/GDSL hydrolase family protein [Carbonactinospora thermoautotrophica]